MKKVFLSENISFVFPFQLGVHLLRLRRRGPGLVLRLVVGGEGLARAGQEHHRSGARVPQDRHWGLHAGMI